MNELTTQPNPFALVTFEDVERMANYMADARVYGFKKASQVISAQLLAHETGKTLSQLMEEKHFFEDGKISPKSSHLQARFQKTGTILWHIRTNTVVAGSFFTIKPITDADRARACDRFELQYELDIMQLSGIPEDAKEMDIYRKRESELLLALSKLARENECTIIRTMAQAAALKLSEKSNYLLGAANMHQWRCISDAIKLIAPEMLEGGSPDVDIQDLQAVSTTLAIEQKSPKDREKDAIKAMMAQHLEDAETAHPERKRELLGLAAELRCKLAEMDGGIVVATARDERSNLIAAKIVDATDATVMRAADWIDPSKGPNSPTVDDDQLPDQLPGIAEPAPPKPKNWKDYVLKTFKVSAYKNKRLGDLSKEEVAVLHASMQKKDMNSASQEVRVEAANIALAFESGK